MVVAVLLLRQRTAAAVLEVVVLVVVLGRVERAGLVGANDLRGDLAVLEAGVRLLLVGDEGVGLLELLAVGGEDRRAIAVAHIRALAVDLRGVVELEEPSEQVV